MVRDPKIFSDTLVERSVSVRSPAESHCDGGKVFQAINFKLNIHTFGVLGQCSIDFQTDLTKIEPGGGGTCENFLIAWQQRVVVVLRTPCLANNISREYGTEIILEIYAY